MEQNEKRQHPGETAGSKPVLNKTLKIAYLALFAVSLVVVGLYLFLNFGIKTPVVDPPPINTGDPGSSGSTVDPGNTEDPGNSGNEEDGLKRKDGVYTCLIFGMDDGNGNADTIMVATFDTVNGAIGLVSIPRDTIISQDRSPSLNKINAAYALGGVEQMEAEVEELLGIPIDYYIKIRLSAFEKLVNTVGGVWYDVPVDMHYVDPDQNLVINLSKGYQRLNGEQAMGLVRFRQNNSGVGYGDTGRAATQQAFLKTMLAQVLKGAGIDDVPALMDILLNYVQTDASVNDMLYFGRALVAMKVEEAITTATLPGNWHSPYIWVDKNKALSLINSLLNPYTTDVTEDMVEFFQ